MGIPRIDAYDMPSADSLPRNRVDWTPSATRAVLLVHDLQDYFLDFYDTARSPISELLDNVQQLSRRARELGIPVVYTAQPHEQTAEQRALLNDMWGPGITVTPDRSAIVEALHPEAGDHVLTKWRYSAFQRTTLLESLRSWKRDQLLITGVYAHIGCLLTASEAFMHDVQPILIADAIADFSSAEHRMALSYVAGCCGAVTTSSRLLSVLATASNPRTSQTASTYEAVAQEIAELLDVSASELSPDDSLLDWGLDSIRIMTLVERWRARGLDVSFITLAESPTLVSYTQLFEVHPS